MSDRQPPTPDEIRAACAVIREGWSEERWSREMTEADRRWELPVVSSNVSRNRDGLHD
jgi:hypothetical protein